MTGFSFSQKFHFCRLCFILLLFWLPVPVVSAFTITDGYAERTSYSPGDTVRVYLNSSIVIQNWTIYLKDIEGVKADSVSVNLFPQGISQPEPWVNGFGYNLTFSYIIPLSMSSGIYCWADKVFFIVKNPLKNAEITIIYPTNTEAAYNEAGGKSLYGFNSPDGSAKAVTFKRPLSSFVISQIRTYCKRFLEWIHTQGSYNIQYIADSDLEDYTEIMYTRLLVVVGHSEYWTRNARLNFDSLVNSGKDAVIFAGNTMWWQVRYSDNGNTLVCYKDKVSDPEPDPLLKTINWPDTSLHYPVLNSIGVDFIHGAYGMKPYHGWYGYKILKPDSPLLEGTGLAFNDTVSCQSKEYDATLFCSFPGNLDPVVDTTTLGFCKIELIGYDWGKSIYNTGEQKSYGTFIAFKRSPSSGNIVNTGFSNWCTRNGGQGAMGGFGGKDSTKIKMITLNILNKLLNRDNIFAAPKQECNPVGTGKSPHFSEDIIIYPNPGKGEFHISADYTTGGALLIDLYNTLSNKVYTRVLSESDKYCFNISFFSEGIYLYRISRNGIFLKTGKLIITR